MNSNDNVPFPTSEYIIKRPGIYEEILLNDVPLYLNGLAEKYKMHFKVISVTERAMFNDKCCLIIGIDRRDGVVLRTTFPENGRRVEFIVDNFIQMTFDDSDREGLDLNWKHMSEKIRNDLTIVSRGLDSKWSKFLEGDMGWYEDFKKTVFYRESPVYAELRSKILEEILAWQQGQHNSASYFSYTVKK